MSVIWSFFLVSVGCDCTFFVRHSQQQNMVDQHVPSISKQLRVILYNYVLASNDERGAIVE